MFSVVLWPEVKQVAMVVLTPSFYLKSLRFSVGEIENMLKLPAIQR